MTKALHNRLRGLEDEFKRPSRLCVSRQNRRSDRYQNGLLTSSMNGDSPVNRMKAWRNPWREHWAGPYRSFGSICKRRAAGLE